MKRTFILAVTETDVEGEQSFLLESHNQGFPETSITTIVRAWLRVRDEQDYQDMKSHMES